MLLLLLLLLLNKRRKHFLPATFWLTVQFWTSVKLTLFCYNCVSRFWRPYYLSHSSIPGSTALFIFRVPTHKPHWLRFTLFHFTLDRSARARLRGHDVRRACPLLLGPAFYWLLCCGLLVVYAKSHLLLSVNILLQIRRQNNACVA